MRVVPEEDTLYVYNMHSLDIALKKWVGHSIHIGRIKQSMCLTIHPNRLICLVNDGRTTIWSISEMEELRPNGCYIFNI